MGKALNGYLCMYRGKRYEVHAVTTYEAQCKVAKEHRIKRSWEIDVYLVEKDGQEVSVPTTF
jgi:hypothetical protein